METKVMKRIWAALFAVAATSAATTALAGGVGTTGADFLKIGVGARSLAMGNAASAVVDDANAIYWNPGALGAIKQRGVTTSYSALFKDENQGFLAFVAPLKGDSGTVGVAVDYLIVSNIAKRAGDTESPDSTISNQNVALTGSYGRMTGIDGLSVGGNLKYINQSVDTYSGNTVAIDVGGFYKTRIPNLSAGLSM